VALSESVTGRSGGLAPLALLLVSVYLITAGVFVVFGQWIGHLFKTHKPLWAYSLEVFGSILGILLFAGLSWLGASPIVWFCIGFSLLLAIIRGNILDYGIAAVCVGLALFFCQEISSSSIWSPYYRIQVEPVTSIQDIKNQRIANYTRPVAYALTVNNDYHQMVLDLSPNNTEIDFFRDWRALYDLPYEKAQNLPPGPVLIVGAGTGNDVSAALRKTDRKIVACEIDPVILKLGKDLHFERPYENPRVEVVVDDARSFFQKTGGKFAMVVFGFLDSHTPLSSFSSLRLDNFVYTMDSIKKARQILLPGGKICLTFASNEQWIHDRFVHMLGLIFQNPTDVYHNKEGYANGIVYMNFKAREGSEAGIPAVPDKSLVLPADDWPFLYLKAPGIPDHYIVFIAIALLLGCGSMLLLPKGQRKIHFPYFFLGAAFFLIETSNVVTLSLIYGSTWFVNVTVFTGILALVLLGNLTSHLMKTPRLEMVAGLLAVSILVAYLVPTSSLLSIENRLLQAVAAVLTYLGPVYFASLIFAGLIKDETRLYQAYGSNVLGAVAGGVGEYLSLVFGFKFLLGIALVFYIVVYVLVKSEKGLSRSWRPSAT